jgi:hypothetical protein
VVSSDARGAGQAELSRVCRFAKLSLAGRFRNILAEEDRGDPKSCWHQASEIESSFRRITMVIKEVRDLHQGVPEGEGIVDGFACIQQMCEGMRRRVDAEVRRADPSSPWIQAGQLMIAEAYRLICDVEGFLASGIGTVVACPMQGLEFPHGDTDNGIA